MFDERIRHDGRLHCDALDTSAPLSLAPEVSPCAG